MRCQEIQKKLTLFLDNELSDDERVEIERHLSACSDCNRALEILTSIDSIGKVEPFSEPEPEYWKQLHQNIMQQIAERETKPHWILEGLAQLRRLLWPGKISYRLAGLAVTAVIVFFMVRISFFHNGKVETPNEISKKDSTEISDSTRFRIAAQPLIGSGEEIQKAKHKAITSPPVRDKDVGLLKARKSASISEIPSPAVPEEDRSLASSKVATAIAIEEVSDTPPPSVSVLNQAAQTEREPQLDRALSKKNSAQSQFEKTHVQLNMVSKRLSQSESDSSFNQFMKISQQARAIPELAKKIAIWEKYMQTNPETKFVHQAKCELAVLYFELANENPAPDNIHQALTFYSENAGLLFSTADSIKFKDRLRALQTLEKK